MTRGPNWTSKEWSIALDKILEFPKDTPGSILAPAILKVLPHRPIGGIETVLYRIDNAGRGQTYRKDGLNVVKQIRSLMFDRAMVATRTVPTWKRVSGHEHTKKRANPNNTPGISKSASNLVLDWRLDTDNWENWSVEKVVKGFNMFRASIGLPPQLLVTIRRYRNGYIKRNAGYKNGGNKLFAIYANLLTTHN